MEDRLAEANQDPSVHGIIIYYPVFGSKPSFFGTTMDDELRDKVRSCHTKALSSTLTLTKSDFSAPQTTLIHHAARPAYQRKFNVAHPRT